MKISISTSESCIHIEDSYNVCKFLMEDILRDIKLHNPNLAIWKVRSIKSMKREWVVHNALYRMNIARSRTKDVYFNYPQKWYARLGYYILYIPCSVICI